MYLNMTLVRGILDFISNRAAQKLKPGSLYNQAFLKRPFGSCFCLCCRLWGKRQCHRQNDHPEKKSSKNPFLVTVLELYPGRCFGLKGITGSCSQLGKNCCLALIAFIALAKLCGQVPDQQPSQIQTRTSAAHDATLSTKTRLHQNRWACSRSDWEVRSLT